MEEMRNAYKILVGKPEGKRPRGRFRRRWEDNIRMDIRDIGLESVDCNCTLVIYAAICQLQSILMEVKPVRNNPWEH
jgi:hypothetical protein